MSEQQVFIRDLWDYTKKGYRIVILTESSLRIPRIVSYLQEEELPAKGSERPEEIPAPGKLR